ncbi:hypothetical protein AXF42_Ash008686 [Apostasia shenzhenica]|uniref:Uncharacterized protein n=1 Tax=Apostasia shenzhenica TaxID=1088818 RepID=A0A2I0B258_9ASPA|nr:hypothetical protein AXF42_Ash008686 [Apostasia shenzhenica]
MLTAARISWKKLVQHGNKFAAENSRRIKKKPQNQEKKSHNQEKIVKILQIN